MEHAPYNRVLYDAYGRIADFTEGHAETIRAIRVHNDDAGYLEALLGGL